jgi:hypothetical protein
VELYVPKLLGESLRRDWDPTGLAERLAPLDSPFRLGSLLTPINGAVFRRREGKQRLIFVPERLSDASWRLVLVAVIDRDTGDQQQGEYRRLLDQTQHAPNTLATLPRFSSSITNTCRSSGCSRARPASLSSGPSCRWNAPASVGR